MKLFKFSALTLLLTLVAGCSSDIDPVRYVDTKIGTGGHGHVFVGANVPFGMVQVGPTSIPQQWDWCSGYHDSDNSVIGFSHTHLSGTGIGDLFDVTLMPVVGEVVYARGEADDMTGGMWSPADRSREVSTPGYYSVPLMRYGITAEMTATTRVGLQRYTFPESEEAAIVLDLQNGGCWDKPTDTGVTILSENSLSGWRHSEGWAKNQKVFFYLECDHNWTGVEKGGENDMYTRLKFNTKDGEKIMVKVALSAVSEQGAKEAMEAELPGWDFQAVRTAAEQAWREELSKIIVKGDEDEMTKFYTALYHSMIAPSVFSDINGDYRGADGEVYNAPFVNYTTYSLWDTYRAAMPLYTVIHPERTNDIIKSMMAIGDHQGRLPVWHLWGCETDCMVGNPGSVIVADAIAKNIGDFDREHAFELICRTQDNPGRGNGLRLEYGYIPCDLYGEAVANDMEYAISDGAAAQAALALGKEQQAQEFTRRSHSYRNYFCPETRFMRGRDSKGGWREDFNPFASAHRADDYCEGNAWQYTWLVPQDVEGLKECFQTKEAMISKLDSLFTVPSVIEGMETSPDISGLIGQYAHGNEPSHHVLYLYTMLGEPYKTSEKVNEVLYNLYHRNADGLAGNEDVGQMSSWFVMSSMGFYQVEPAGARFWFGCPHFPEMKVSVGDNTLTIRAEGLSKENIYIQSITLDNEPYTLPYITYQRLMQGGELTFQMGAQKSVWYE